jgi:hypothetical protein
VLNCFQWRDRSNEDLQLFGRQAALELQSRIPGFPPFLLSPSSHLPKRRSGCRPWHIASAHTSSYFLRYALYSRPRWPHIWTIEFNDHHPYLFDMDMVLYHELAHFMARRLDMFSPSHGLLWATCCDALMLVMDLDPDSRDEGTSYIFEVEAGERFETFRREHVADAAHWRQVRSRALTVLVHLLEQSGVPIRYDDLLTVVRAAHLRCRPKPPPPKPKRRRAPRVTAA